MTLCPPPHPIHDAFERAPTRLPRLRSATMWRDGNQTRSTFRLCLDPDGYRHACAMPVSTYAARRAREHGRCLVAWGSECALLAGPVTLTLPLWPPSVAR